MMKIDTPDTLERLGDLLEQGWCQGCYARDADEDSVSYLSESAVSFCLVGGARHLAGLIGAPHINEVLCESINILGPYDSNCPELADWNDAEERTKDEVVSLCRDTAKRLRVSS